MRRVISVRNIGLMCTCSVGVMSIVLMQVTGLELAVAESAGTGCTNGVGVELLGTEFANTMQMGTGLMGSGSTGTVLVDTV